MSEIPFVNQLGESLGQAIRVAERRATTVRRRRRRARWAALALALLAVTSVAVARVLDDPVSRAAAGVGCYDSAGNLTGISPGDLTPVAACAAALRATGVTPGPLVACEGRGAVEVVPGTGPEACTANGRRPLSASYGPARDRVLALEHGIRSLQSSRDCVPRATMLKDVQGLLDRLGWTGWRAVLASGEAGSGPCGFVGSGGGNGIWTITGSVLADGRRVLVSTGASASARATAEELAPELQDASGTRCFTRDALTAEARSIIGAAGHDARFTSSPKPTGLDLDQRERLYDAGCPLVAAVVPVGAGRVLEVQMYQKG